MPVQVEKKDETSMARRYFEDITDGEYLDCQAVSVTREDIIAFAKKFDPQPFHMDEDAASKSIFGGLIASSLHILSACTRTVVEAQGNVAILSGVGMDETKMFNPVRPDDILYVEAWWTNLKRSRRNPNHGLAAIQCKVTNQKGDPVIEYGYRYLLACKNSNQPEKKQQIDS
ncbi:MAG: MaoC/PaaZ C-terminal domain-containing protein [Thermodesulfobacteriota bacterium]